MTVLVLGSTGNVGPHVVSALVDANVAVRVLTRDANRARDVLPDSAEVFAGDPADERELRAAAEGASAVLLLSGHGSSMAETQLRVIRALRRDPARIIKLRRR